MTAEFLVLLLENKMPILLVAAFGAAVDALGSELTWHCLSFRPSSYPSNVFACMWASTADASSRFLSLSFSVRRALAVKKERDSLHEGSSEEKAREASEAVAFQRRPRRRSSTAGQCSGSSVQKCGHFAQRRRRMRRSISGSSHQWQVAWKRMRRA